MYDRNTTTVRSLGAQCALTALSLRSYCACITLYEFVPVSRTLLVRPHGAPDAMMSLLVRSRRSTGACSTFPVRFQCALILQCDLPPTGINTAPSPERVERVESELKAYWDRIRSLLRTHRAQWGRTERRGSELKAHRWSY